MKNILLVLFLAISTGVSAATYYIDPSGSDTNIGSSSSPWKTLAYACSKVNTAGDIIHVNAGTYIENSRCSVSPGVSIEGAGNNSIINTSYNAGERNGTIALLSPSGAPVNGNQSISYIKINCGSNTGTTAIAVEFRSNVTIHHVTIENSKSYGIWFFNNTNGWLSAPTIHATGNKVYDCTFINCEHRFEGQSGFLYYNNIHDNSAIIAKCLTSDWMKGWKIYGNTFSKGFDSEGWNFIFETWHFSDECEIYKNVFKGEFSLDLSDIRKGSGSYGLKVYNNQFIRDAVGLVNNCYTLNVEGWGAIQYLYIYNNYFKNVSSPISIGSYNQGNCVYPNGTNWALDHIYVSYNIVENSGSTNSKIPSFFWFWENAVSGYSLNQLYDEIYICNNTWVSIANSYRNQYGMYIDISRPATNFHIDNNILVGSEGYGIVFPHGSNFNTMSIQNNILYNNGNNTVFYSSAPSNLTTSNFTSNPLLTSSTDFHLLPGSPAIGKGVVISGLYTDFAGNTLKNPPNIGAYESNSVVAPLLLPVYQNSVIQNVSPFLLEMTYNASLADIVPSNSAFTILVNSVARSVNSVSISGAKVLLTLSSAIKFGDIVTVSYTKPATNPLQNTAGGQAISISTQLIVNNIVSPATNPVTSKIGMTIFPNPVHQIINIQFDYTGTFSVSDVTKSPQIIRIFDITGKLYIEKLLDTGVKNAQLPINLKPDIYTVIVLSGGVTMASQKMIVY
jgi:uncharacterized repeat protein (TIGR02059 family)